MPRIVQRPQALADVDEIWLHIARQGDIEQADRVIDRIKSKLDMLSRQPQMGKNRSDIKMGLRSFPVYRYLIFYLPLADGIEVVRILYGGRDLNTIDFDDEE